MAKKYIPNINLEGTRFVFRDFSGLKSYNGDGKRTCVVEIPDEATALALSADGWSIKTRQPKVNVGTSEDPIWMEDTNADVQYTLNVTIKFGDYPPEIYMVSPDGNTVTPVNEATVGLLDKAWVRSVDCVISPYAWSYGKKNGITAYLKLMYVQLDKDINSGNVDPFKAKYGARVVQAPDPAVMEAQQYNDEDLPY